MKMVFIIIFQKKNAQVKASLQNGDVCALAGGACRCKYASSYQATPCWPLQILYREIGITPIKNERVIALDQALKCDSFSLRYY